MQVVYGDAVLHSQGYRIRAHARRPYFMMFFGEGFESHILHQRFGFVESAKIVTYVISLGLCTRDLSWVWLVFRPTRLSLASMWGWCGVPEDLGHRL